MTMKKIKEISIKFIVVSITICAYCGCNKSFLTPTATTDLNEQSVFTDSVRTMEFFVGIYSRMNFGTNVSVEVNSVGGVLSETTDEAETRWPGAHNVPNQVFGGTFGAAFYSKIDNEWSYFYTG